MTIHFDDIENILERARWFEIFNHLGTTEGTSHLKRTQFPLGSSRSLLAHHFSRILMAANLDLTDKTQQTLTDAIQLAKDYAHAQGRFGDPISHVFHADILVCSPPSTYSLCFDQ
jgi:hypothetical protein